jgi:hypothetical protein
VKIVTFRGMTSGLIETQIFIWQIVPKVIGPQIVLSTHTVVKSANIVKKALIVWITYKTLFLDGVIQTHGHIMDSCFSLISECKYPKTREEKSG